MGDVSDQVGDVSVGGSMGGMATANCVICAYFTWSHDSHVTSSRALCGPPVHPEVLSDQYWDMRLSGLTTCLCLLFLLSALLTRVVCAHALLVFTSVSPSKMVRLCLSVCVCNCEARFSDFSAVIEHM